MARMAEPMLLILTGTAPARIGELGGEHPHSNPTLRLVFSLKNAFLS
jgi:hypothetical protein